MALVDTGAEVNCMGTRLMTRLTGDPVDVDIRQLRGLGGGSPVPRWLAVRLQLENGQEETVTFAEVPGLCAGAIVGVPFLIRAKAKVDLASGLVDTASGAVELYPGPHMDLGSRVFTCASVPPDVANPVPDRVEAALASSRLESSERLEVGALLRKFDALWTNDVRGVTTVLQHRIEVTTSRPLATRPRRLAPSQQRIIDAEVETMLAQGVIQPSFSPHAADVVLVKKKTGEWQVCVDYRLVNLHTRGDSHPLPSIQDLLRAVRDSAFFVALDLRAGYWQVLMEEGSRQYTAFRTPRGLMEFVVMPFGLKNAPATFQRLMEAVLGSLHWDGVLVYLDDILVHGASFAQTRDRLEIVLKRLRDAGLTLNLPKCSFFPDSMPYLGFLLEQGVVRPDPRKVAALRRVRVARTVKGVRQFLGMAGFYRQCIRDYARKAEPLTRLLSTKTQFVWGEDQRNSVQQLLSGLEDVVLANPLEGDRWLLETDASDIAIGAILSCARGEEPWRVVEYGSKQLNPTQRRWPVHEREAWAIVWAVERYDCYLRGRAFTVHTDNSSLQWMAQATCGKIARWAARLAEYEMTIYYKRGAQLQHVDFFSRQGTDAEEGLADRMLWLVTTGDFPTVEDVLAAQKTEPPRWGRGYAARGAVIYYRGRLYVPPTLRNNVVACAHALHPLVHPGARKTKSTVLKAFNWPGLHQDVTTFIRGCLLCQRLRPGVEQLQGRVLAHPEGEAFERVYIDVWKATIGGSEFKLLTMIDWTTRWVEVVELDNESGDAIAKAFLCGWVARFGCPRHLVSDRGPAFLGEVFERLCSLLGVRHLRTAPYHPQGNAPVESFHRTLNKGLAQFAQLRGAGLPFSEQVALILLGYRSTLHAALGDSPAYLAFGIDPRPAQERDWRLARTVAEQDRVRYLSLIRLELISRAELRGAIAKDPLAEERSSREFALGDLVLVRATDKELHAASRAEGSRKIRPKWSLPYRVVRISESGQVATVRSCVTDDRRGVSLRDTHINNVRFLERPCTPSQRADWERLVERHLEPTVLDRATRLEHIRKFWESVEQPLSDRKRGRGSESDA